LFHLVGNDDAARAATEQMVISIGKYLTGLAGSGATKVAPFFHLHQIFPELTHLQLTHF